MTEMEMKLLAAWYRAEFKRRTKAVQGGGGKLDWLVRDYRVSRTEIQSHAESLGIKLNVNDWLELFNYVNAKKGKRNA